MNTADGEPGALGLKKRKVLPTNHGKVKGHTCAHHSIMYVLYYYYNILYTICGQISLVSSNTFGSTFGLFLAQLVLGLTTSATRIIFGMTSQMVLCLHSHERHEQLLADVLRGVCWDS